jgi:hypothetical protein
MLVKKAFMTLAVAAAWWHHRHQPTTRALPANEEQEMPMMNVLHAVMTLGKSKGINRSIAIAWTMIVT